MLSRCCAVEHDGGGSARWDDSNPLKVAAISFLLTLPMVMMDEPYIVIPAVITCYALFAALIYVAARQGTVRLQFTKADVEFREAMNTWLNDECLVASSSVRQELQEDFEKSVTSFKYGTGENTDMPAA